MQQPIIKRHTSGHTHRQRSEEKYKNNKEINIYIRTSSSESRQTYVPRSTVLQSWAEEGTEPAIGIVYETSCVISRTQRNCGLSC